MENPFDSIRCTKEQERSIAFIIDKSSSIQEDQLLSSVKLILNFIKYLIYFYRDKKEIINLSTQLQESISIYFMKSILSVKVFLNNLSSFSIKYSLDTYYMYIHFTVSFSFLFFFF